MNLQAPVRRGLATATVAGAALLTIAACQPGTRVVTAAPATATAEQAADQPTSTTPVSAATSAAATSTDAVGKGAGGPGSLTVAITSPVAVSGHVDTVVSCQTAGARYVASASGSVHGYAVSDVVRVAGYHGPGSYQASVTVSMTGPDAHYAVTAVPATAQVTATGGDVSFSATSTGGRTLAGSIAWACSA
ncbi:hypothetical protein CcI156_09055 [Frankia sp. CcI156]|uniref:hypothetical protein n=1 Tax=Frankia TaxID=1854 RepID=UPI0003D03491|nr:MULTISPECIES: hypothetical protein [Frankia]ETA04046.1 hypothetical protein CcI6DRAFT_00570 [Frankia sp. CcI6]KDA44187.1 hypothetical protein BMG523Draft_00986 [Frankia sp. BMG5.23]KEZ37800.1 hypothetical protein CEDDRAFT_00642 [Frankia sp. CeD]OAA30793.1 hypothetical protein AAY23_100544 [Frankia casuarinae]OHV57481.1 hypothetical protein CgIS1_02045 [Frankia sp. CgIS1]